MKFLNQIVIESGVNPPLSISSTRWVDKLNVDMVDDKHASDFAAAAHQATHQTGGLDALAGNIDANARVEVRIPANSITGSPAFAATRRILNLVPGNENVSLSGSTVGEVISVTISATGGGGGELPAVPDGNGYYVLRRTAPGPSGLDWVMLMADNVL